MQLQTCFKQTDAGVVPDDWAVSLLGELCVTSSGTTPSRAQYNRYFRDGKFHWVKTLDLTNSEIYLTDERVTQAALEETSLKIYSPETVLIAMYGGFNQIGRTGLLRVPAAVNQAITAVRPDPSILDSEFLLYLLNYRVEYWKRIASSSRKDPNITSQDIKRFPLAFPPVSEQRKIATALSDVDALLSSLDQLIAKKRTIRHVVIQALLTGRQRLPGFEGPWRAQQLSTLVQTPITDGPHLTPQFVKDGIPFLSVNNIVDNKLDLSDLRYISQSDHEAFSRKCRPIKGDILLGKAASVGKVAIVDLDMEFNIWSPIALIRIRSDHSSEFFYYQFQTTDIQRQIEVLTNSSSQGNIGMSDINRIVFHFPSIKEQEAIVEVLSDIDGELANLEARRGKTRDLKQGMMQELLTGRTRLV